MPAGNPIKMITYEEINRLTHYKDVLVIDVRERFELEKTGVIPNSINIPLIEIENALNYTLSSEEFSKHYGRSKPTLDCPIVLTCRTCNRSGKASVLARKFGYNNVSVYSGGWLEWEKKQAKTHYTAN